MAGKIFINYRREDTRDAAARVRDRLAAAFGPKNVFMDVDNLMAGQRFDQELRKALDQCDVFLAVIGPRWQQVLSERTEAAGRDYVREEIAEALKRGVAVIPVTIERTPLPSDDRLPDDLKALVLHQKHDISYEKFGRDVEELVAAIRSLARGGRAPLPWGKMAVGAVVGAVAIAIVAGVALDIPTKLGFEAYFETGPSTQAADEPFFDIAPITTGRSAGPKEPVYMPVPSADAVPRASDEAVRKEEERLAMLAEEGRKRKETEAVAKKAEDEPKARESSEAMKPGRVFRDCEDKDASGNYICPEMVIVPAGSFMMGSPEDEEERQSDEGPQRSVAIPNLFAVGKYEVTFAEWDSCVAASRCKTKPDDEKWGRGKRPVINVSWDDAKQYAAWLSKKTGKSYRLLSEAEWEYAARAGTKTQFSTGETITTHQANFWDSSTHGGSSEGKYRDRTIEVGSFEPNAFGLYDMHGNVWEWVEDCYNDSYQGAPTNGAASTSGDCSLRVLRGGSFNYVPGFLRAACRLTHERGNWNSSYGFRLARSLE